MKKRLRFFLLAGFALATFPVLADLIFVHTDHLGNPVAYTNGNGEVIGREYYTPYGESLNPPTTDDTISYTGHYRDGDTGLLYMQARYYDPEIARFLSVDPVTFSPDKPQYFNRYWYAAGNPVMNTDPDGRHFITKLVKFIANGGDAAATFGGMAEDAATLVNPAASGGQKALAAVSLASEVFSPVSLKEGKAIAEGVEGALRHGDGAGDAAKTAPDFLVTSRGEAIPVPDGATGPHPTRASGVQFTGGSGGKSMDSRVDGVRVMGANSNQGARAVYMNRMGQTVNPATGRTVSNDDPAAHHYLDE